MIGYKSMLKYKGYTGHVEFDDESDIFHGEVLDLRDVITFQGRSVEEIEQGIKVILVKAFASQQFNLFIQKAIERQLHGAESGFIPGHIQSKTTLIRFENTRIGDRSIMFKSVASYSDKPLNTATVMMHHGPILSLKIRVLWNRGGYNGKNSEDGHHRRAHCLSYHLQDCPGR